MRTNVIRKFGLSLLIGTFAFGMTAYANPSEGNYATIKTEGAVLVGTPNSESVDIRELAKDEVIRIGDQVDNYTEVILAYGKVAYIDAKYIEEPAKEEVKEAPAKETPAKKEPVAVKSNKGQEVVQFALKHVGNPYRYGGTSLTNGADCSGFTSQVYKNLGVSISRTSGGQYSGNGTSVKKADLQPGDLVFYGYSGKINHVAIYMGDNKIVHAGSARTGIHVSPLQQRGMAPYIGAKRII